MTSGKHRTSCAATFRRRFGIMQCQAGFGAGALVELRSRTTDMILIGPNQSVRVMQLVVLCGVTACAAALAFTAGCQHEDFARDQMEMRKERIAEVADAIERSEGSRPEKLGRTTDRISETVAIDERRMSRNYRALDDYVRHDWMRWRSRLPEYRYHTERILWGRPESIERNAIILFY